MKVPVNIKLSPKAFILDGEVKGKAPNLALYEVEV